MDERTGKMTTTKLAKLAGLSQAYIRQLILGGRIKAEKVGRDWVIPDQVAQDFLRGRGQKGR